MSVETEKPRRRYQKRRRAEQEEDTRRRIAEAAVELHGSVGPARTTISAVAATAGVQRATVYRHFPDEASLFQACSAHWAAAHPVPDPEPWRAIDDPDARLRAALSELYAFYRDVEPMLTNVTRDADRMPALRAVGQRQRDYLEAVGSVLAEGFAAGDGQLLYAAIAMALDFRTWRLLAFEGGLDDAGAVDLMTRTVRCACSAG